MKFIGVVLGNGKRKVRLSTSSMMPEQRLCFLKYSKDVTNNWITEENVQNKIEFIYLLSLLSKVSRMVLVFNPFSIVISGEKGPLT